MDINNNDYAESNINYFHNGGGRLTCTFYTSKESVKNRVLKRNNNCKVTSDGYGWMLEYPREEVRDPSMWLRVKGKEDEE